MDASFEVEIAVLQEWHSGQSARSAMEKAVLEKFPSNEGGSLEATLQALRDLREGEQHRFADSVVQHVLDDVYDVLSQLQSHRPPHEAHMQDEWGLQLLARMPNFLIHEQVQQVDKGLCS